MFNNATRKSSSPGKYVGALRKTWFTPNSPVPAKPHFPCDHDRTSGDPPTPVTATLKGINLQRPGQRPAYPAYPRSGVRAPKPLPNPFTLSVTVRRVRYFRLL